MLKIIASILLIISTSIQASPFKIGAYTEFPYGSGVQTRFGIFPGPVEFKLGVAPLTPGFVKSHSDHLLDAGQINLDQAIIYDNTYEEGFLIDIAIGSKNPQNFKATLL